MKKKIIGIFILTIIFSSIHLVVYGAIQVCTHPTWAENYQNYSSTQHYSKQCSNSDCKQFFELKNHDWEPATCTSPMKCKYCNATSGSANGHSWSAATCTSPKTCSVCGATSGSANEHSWETDYYDKDASSHYTKRCKNCGKRSGSQSHTSELSYIKSTDKYHINRYTCTLCGNTKDDDFIDHTFGSWSSNGYGTDKKHSKSCIYCEYSIERISFVWFVV